VQIYEESILRVAELFHKEFAGDEVQCKMQGDEKCLFRIMEKKESEEKTREKIREMFK
jgi:predicted hydrocarbon binding protein